VTPRRKRRCPACSSRPAPGHQLPTPPLTPPRPTPPHPAAAAVTAAPQLWQFDDKEFTDAESFRAHLHERRIPPELLRLLPKDDPRAPERPAEAALRQRMTELLARCQGLGRALQEEEQPAPPRTGERAPLYPSLLAPPLAPLP
jgi:hypothetical protein